MIVRRAAGYLFCVALSASCAGERERSPEQLDAPRGSAATALVATHGRVLGAALATGFVREGDALRPVLPAAPSGRPRASLAVSLGARADVPVRLADRGGAGVVVHLVGARAAHAEVVAGHLVYRGALPDADLVHRPSEDGNEDHLVFASAPADPSARWSVELSGAAAGYRLVASVLEILDADGTPRIRVAPPYLVDARSTRHAARVALEGCAHDTDPRGPWGRPVVAPGAPSCTVAVSWDGLPVEYPAVLDPAWKSAGSMVVPRSEHAMVALDGGKLLIVGGVATLKAELYAAPAPNDWGSPGSFAATVDLPFPAGVIRTIAARLPAGRALVAGGAHDLGGGFKNGYANAAVYDGATGTWKSVPSLSSTRWRHAASALPDGRVLISGGDQIVSNNSKPLATTELFVPDGSGGGSFVPGPQMASVRTMHTQTTLVDGSVLVIAGRGASNAALATTERLLPGAAAWTPAPTLAVARYAHTSTLLADSRVLVAGGRDSDGTSILAWLVSIELFAPSPAPGAISTLGSLFAARGNHTATQIADGTVLLAGGEGILSELPSVEIYTVAGGTGFSVPSPEAFPARTYHAAAYLGGARVLVTGGLMSFADTDSTALHDRYPLGVVCKAGGDCASGFCTDGVCCEKACAGDCEACTKAKRGTSAADGTCGPIAEKLPARQGGGCKDETLTTNPCGTTGTCDGNGACRNRPLATQCGASVCKPPMLAISACDGKGSCVTAPDCGSYTKCASDTACASSCTSAADCVASAFCGAGQCKFKAALGQACLAAFGGLDCASGQCVDGVCCNDPCKGDCRTCRGEPQGKGPSGDGTCGFVAKGSDPRNNCGVDPPSSCQSVGTCDGSGACSLYDASTVCGPGSTCAVGDGGQSSVYAYRCVKGACLPEAAQQCGGFPCDPAGVACAISCAGNAACSPGAFCNSSSKCEKRRALGEACVVAGECASAVCAGGLCCNTACEGQCETCASPAAKGTCVGVVGAAPAGKPSCGGGGAASPCSASRCDGATRTSCSGYVGSEVACGEAGCVGATAIAKATCAGDGHCREPIVTGCSPYACHAGACTSACKTDAECAGGGRCDGGKCIAAAQCADGATLRLIDGTTKSCAPFRCSTAVRGCLGSCESGADCSAGSVCGADRRCGPPLEDASAYDSGCSVAPGRRASPFASLALLVTIAIARRRRARLAQSAGASLAALVACSTAPETGGPPATLLTASSSPDRSTASFATPQQRDATGLAAVSLGERASDPFTLRDEGSGLSVSVTPQGARPVRGVPSSDVVVHRGALAHGGTLFVRKLSRGVEDFAYFPGPTAPSEVAYDVELGSSVAGLRLVENVLEIVDAGGAPRLRVNRPWVAGADGARHAARLDVVGCQVDRSPVAPWGRPATDPGARRCTVTLAWDRLPPPVLVDPGWTTVAGHMTETRAGHTATFVTVGGALRVLLAAGTDALTAGSLRKTADLFDPLTNTVATTGSLKNGRGGHQAYSLPGGNVLVAGGEGASDALSSLSEVYDAASGTWAVCGQINGERYTQAGARLADGRAMIIGGYTPNPDAWYRDAQIFDEGTCTWTKTADMSQRRRYHAATTLADGRVLVVGGMVVPDGTTTEKLAASTEVWDPATGVWSLGPSMKIGRQYPSLALLPEGVLAVGGLQLGIPTASGDFLRLSTFAWEPTPDMASPRLGGISAHIPLLGRGLVAFGYGFAAPAFFGETFDPKANAWTKGGTTVEVRAFATGTLLPDGRVLATGGGQIKLASLTNVLDTLETFVVSNPGEGCVSDAECTTSHCVDGVCCDKACTGSCSACSAAKKGGGVNGVCAVVAKGMDPHDDCVAQEPATCGTNGACNGAGGCELFPDGVACAKSCVSGTLNTGSCSAGKCDVKQTTCGLFACGPDGCFTTCMTQLECAPTATCSNGKCVPDAGIGAACVAGGSGCLSGYCVDGVCCSEACDAPCMACKASLQAPVALPKENKDGLCLAAKAGIKDPHDACKDSGPQCQENGICNGDGTCRKYQTGDVCFPGVCTGDLSVGFSRTAYACDATLACLPSKATQSCGNYVCQSGVCQTTCTTEKDCRASAFCEAGKCVDRHATGVTCTTGAECATGFCADGVCCSAKCDGQCAGCAEKGTVGQCVPVSGAPRGARLACGAPNPASPCSVPRCDGVTTVSCAGLAGGETECRPASCGLGHEQYAARCDGKGKCGEIVARLCDPYTCGTGVCRDRCDNDTQCIAGNRCVSQKCVPLPICEADGVLRAKDGAVVRTCGLFRCIPEEGTCATGCVTSADCVRGAVCGSDGACAPPSSPRDESGCACSVHGSRGGDGSRPNAVLLLAPFLAMLVRRRARFARVSRPGSQT